MVILEYGKSLIQMTNTLMRRKDTKSSNTCLQLQHSGRLRSEDHKFKFSLDNLTRYYLKIKTKRTRFNQQKKKKKTGGEKKRKEIQKEHHFEVQT